MRGEELYAQGEGHGGSGAAGELAAAGLFGAAGLVVIYAVASWIVLLTGSSVIPRWQAGIAGVVGPLSILVLPLALAGWLVERGARGVSTRAVEAMRMLALLFVMGAAGFIFVVISGVLGRHAVVGNRVGAGVGAALVALVPSAAVLLLRNSRIVRGAGFTAALFLMALFGLALGTGSGVLIH